MEKVLLQFDQNQFHDRVKKLSIYLPMLKDILSSYMALNIPGDLTELEFKSLVVDPSSFVFDKITEGKDVKLAGLNLNKEQAFSLLEKPAGYDSMLKLIETFKASATNWNYYLEVSSINDGSICLCPNTVKKEKASCSIYARTEKQIRAFKFAQAVCEKATEIFGEGKISDLGAFIQKTVQPIYDSGADKSYKINYKGILDESIFRA